MHAYAHTTYQVQLKHNYSAWPQACDGFTTKHAQQAHTDTCMLVLEPSSFQKKGIQYTHVQHIHTCILTLSFPLSTKCVYTIHACVYTETCMLVLGPSSFQETCIQYTHVQHIYTHLLTLSFPLSTKYVDTIHACNTVTLQLTQWHSFPLSTKHMHYTRTQHIHIPTYTLTHAFSFVRKMCIHYTHVQFFSFHKTYITLYTYICKLQHIYIPTYTPTLTVFLFPQNIYTIHACNTFTLQLTHWHIQFSSFRKMCIHYTRVQFSSFHKTYKTLYTLATHHTIA